MVQIYIDKIWNTKYNLPKRNLWRCVMPYNEFETQAWQYFEIAKEKLAAGKKNEALSNFNMAYNIAQKNNMYGLISQIDVYLRELK